MKKAIILIFSALSLTAVAQNSSFGDYLKSMNAEYDSVARGYNQDYNAEKERMQAEYDKFRREANEKYAEFLRKAWDACPIHEAEKPVEEKTLPPVVYNEPDPEPAPKNKPQTQPHTQTKPQPQTQPREEEKPLPKETIEPVTTPRPAIDVKPAPIAVNPKVIVIPTPQPAPKPVAPVMPKEEPYKKITVAFFGNLVTIGFPKTDDLKLRSAEENAVADAWKKLSDSKYDITVSTALNARKANTFCDWAYMNLLREVTEKQYGKTNEAVLMQAYLMSQSGYKIRLGRSEEKLYMLVASLYTIYHYNYYTLNGTRFYIVTDDKNLKMRFMDIASANFDKEQSLSLQITQLPALNNEPTPKRTLTSKRGVTTSVSLNKNLIDFFNTYPQAYFNGMHTTRWAAYANTPVEQSVKDMLYPPLRKAITGMSEHKAVDILLNWVQTAFEYGFDDKIWGDDRAFFAQETLYYPYCDCEDRAILFSRLVRDLVGLDVVLLYYPRHLATAVAFNEEVPGDYLTYKNRKYVVCDPTFINAPVGRTMHGKNNQEAQIIALQ